jgi:SAM-dependent methyltransferase
LKDERAEQAVQKHYSSQVKTWIDEYQDPKGYPFSRIRLARIRKYLETQNVKRRSILDVGCGVGIPSQELAEPGGEIVGFDLAPELLDYARDRAAEKGLRAEYRVGSVTEKAAYPDRQFELVLALGVFQHVTDDNAALSLMKGCLEPEGLMVLSFRNPLFALVTFNRPSFELFGELFREFREGGDAAVLDEFLKARFDLNLPPERKGGGAAPGIDDIVYRYHNPLELPELLYGVGLRVERLDFYRHHALPPLLQKASPERFMELSLAMDERENDWRSFFLSSTYIAYCRHA